MGVLRDAMDREMARCGLAPRTRKVYLYCIGHLVRFCRRPADQIDAEDLRRYLTHLAYERQVSRSAFNQNVAAARRFFKGRKEWGGRPPRRWSWPRSAC